MQNISYIHRENEINFLSQTLSGIANDITLDAKVYVNNSAQNAPNQILCNSLLSLCNTFLFHKNVIRNTVF